MPGDTAHFTNRPARIPLTTVVIVTWGLILTLALVGLNGISIGGRTVLSIKGLDPMYYFGTSHSLLFEHNFDLRNEFAVLKPQATDAGGFRGLNGLPGSPYAIGYSILSLPLLAVGTALDGAAGRPANGYEGAAIFFYFLGNVLFTVIGMWCLSRFLQAFGLPLWQSAFLPLAIWFSTSLGYYTFTPMAHAATFLLSAAFLLIWWRNRESERVRDWVALGLCGGFLALCRWQDAIFLIAPLLVDLSRHRAAFVRRWSLWVSYATAAAVCWLPQFIQWKELYGRYLTIPQGPGFMEFPPRFILNVLFSTEHGWFLWTPITLIGVSGLVYGSFAAVRGTRNLYWPWLVVILLEVAVIGSMPYNWHCMDSFSIRSLTSCVPLVAFGIAVLLQNSKSVFRRVLYGVMAFCMVYTTIFAAQFRLDLIPRQGTLTMSELFRDKVFFLKAYRRVHSGHKVSTEPGSSLP